MAQMTCFWVSFLDFTRKGALLQIKTIPTTTIATIAAKSSQSNSRQNCFARVKIT